VKAKADCRYLRSDEHIEHRTVIAETSIYRCQCRGDGNVARLKLPAWRIEPDTPGSTVRPGLDGTHVPAEGATIQGASLRAPVCVVFLSMWRLSRSARSFVTVFLARWNSCPALYTVVVYDECIKSTSEVKTFT